MPNPRPPQSYRYLAFTGAAMGAADTVPGVSGGTMAFILGIYQQLIDAIRSFDLKLLGHLLRLDLKAAAEHVPWRFLLALGSGLFVSILSLAHLVTWLLEHQQVLLFAFFFGLVLASIVIVGARVRWTFGRFLALTGGTLFAYWLIGLVPAEGSHDPLTLFGSGALGISAMILPGISGSFILLILGQYAFVLDAVKSLDVVTLLPFAAGCALGLMLFARLLGWLFRHFDQMTVTLLVGFMLGSMRRIWPFKVTVDTMLDRHGQVVPRTQNNILPDPADLTTWLALALALAGFAAIVALHRLQLRMEQRAEADEAGDEPESVDDIPSSPVIDPESAS